MYTLAQNSDKDKIKALWAYAFNEQEPFLSNYFDNFWKAENALIIKNDNTLMASLQMISYDISVRNIIFPSSYIVGVCVSPEFRGQKLSYELMKKCLLYQKEKGQALSLLIPFSYEFYKKLGYNLCYNLSVYETTAENITVSKSINTLREMNISDFEKLNSVYTKFLKDKNGYNLRTKHDWEYIFFEHQLFDGYIYGSFKDGNITGYVSYLKSKQEIYVREFVYTDSDSLYSLLSFIRSHFSGKETIKIRTAHDEILFSLLKEPKNTLKIQPTVMARITDVVSFLSVSDIENLKIKVYDELIEENCGVYEKVNGIILKTHSNNYDISIDIGSLTQLVLGFSSAKELYLKGNITANDESIEKLEKIFPKQNNYINHIMEE